MTLLDPDAGEILDRLSILARKRLEKPDRKHFKDEEEALLIRFVRPLARPSLESYLGPLLRLSAVNMALWQAEDQIRFWRGFFDWRPLSGAEVMVKQRELSALVEHLQTLNEERSRLIQFFNAELGRGAVEEKDFKL